MDNVLSRVPPFTIQRTQRLFEEIKSLLVWKINFSLLLVSAKLSVDSPTGIRSAALKKKNERDSAQCTDLTLFLRFIFHLSLNMTIVFWFFFFLTCWWVEGKAAQQCWAPTVCVPVRQKNNGLYTSLRRHIWLIYGMNICKYKWKAFSSYLKMLYWYLESYCLFTIIAFFHLPRLLYKTVQFCIYSVFCIEMYTLFFNFLVFFLNLFGENFSKM